MLRLLIPGTHGTFTFERGPVVIERPESINLYIHVPFCSSICPFCPYVKQVYDPSLARAYQGALLKELETYYREWGDVHVESVYFGGGTPSLTPEIVETTLDWISGHFQVGREVGMEVHPMSSSDSMLLRLKHAGVMQVSLGVQSFNDRLLDVLGRGYRSRDAIAACERVLAAGFDTIDVDLIFAIPSQTLEESVTDMETALGLGVDQVSTYPLIALSYTPLEGYLKTRGLRLPSMWLERQMLRSMVSRARDCGYERSSIWSFNQPGSSRYTTVTRDAFVGIGAGASSRMGDYFWLNTFSVPEYIKAVQRGSARSLATRLTPADRMAFWLFWQVYDLSIDREACRAMHGNDLPRRIQVLLPLLVLLGFARQEGNAVRLTDRGAYLFHLVEKQYTQSYLKPMWQACLAEAWPERGLL